MKTVLIISDIPYWSMGPNRGGPAFSRTIDAFIDAGWRVLVVGSIAHGDAVDRAGSHLVMATFDCPVFRRFVSIRKIGYLAKALWWFCFQAKSIVRALRLSKTFEINVVYGYEIMGIPAARVMASLLRVPMVARFQGTSYRVGWQGKKFRRLRAWQHWLALRSPADLIIMTNDGTQGDRVLEEFGVPKEKVRFWFNGVDPSMFDEAIDREEARERLRILSTHVLLTVSRLASWKRVDRAIRLLGRVVERHPDTTLIVVGDGPERAKLEELARRCRVTDHVRFEGAVARQELPFYYAACDVFLSLYDWSNVGNPLLEAMAMGCCVVALNTGDTSSVVQDGVTGVLVDPSDVPDGIGRVVSSLLEKPEMREELGRSARAWAQDHLWSWTERMRRELSEVDSLLMRLAQPKNQSELAKK